MMKIYNTNTDTSDFNILKEFRQGCWIDFSNPTEEEVQCLVQDLGVRQDFLNYILDEEEQPRIEKEGDQTLVFVNVPLKEMKHQKTIIHTIPLAILLIGDQYIITISLADSDVLEDFKMGKVKEFYTYKKSRFLIQILYRVALVYLRHLQNINDEIDRAEEQMFQATKNKDLEKLLMIEKSLVYMMSSLKSNEIVLEKILKGSVITLYEEDTSLLDDAIIENKQGIEMANLYREILSSMTDSFATIISNNLNTIMKFLAGITIVISIPTMVASFMGMNVPLGILNENPFAFLILLMISVILSLIIALILKKKNML